MAVAVVAGVVVLVVEEMSAKPGPGAAYQQLAVVGNSVGRGSGLAVHDQQR